MKKAYIQEIQKQTDTSYSVLVIGPKENKVYGGCLSADKALEAGKKLCQELDIEYVQSSIPEGYKKRTEAERPSYVDYNLFWDGKYINSYRSTNSVEVVPEPRNVIDFADFVKYSRISSMYGTPSISLEDTVIKY